MCEFEFLSQMIFCSPSCIGRETNEQLFKVLMKYIYKIFENSRHCAMFQTFSFCRQSTLLYKSSCFLLPEVMCFWWFWNDILGICVAQLTLITSTNQLSSDSWVLELWFERCLHIVITIFQSFWHVCFLEIPSSKIPCCSSLQPEFDKKLP